MKQVQSITLENLRKWIDPKNVVPDHSETDIFFIYSSFTNSINVRKSQEYGLRKTLGYGIGRLLNLSINFN